MVIINEKICDNAKECSGIAVCPTRAIFWNETKGKIDVDNDLCVSCRKCITNGCPIGAIIVVDNQADYEKEMNQIETDARKEEDLHVERYGASSIEEKLLIELREVEKRLSDGKYVFVEKFNDDSIQCLLHSIPIHEIRETLDIEFDYYKCDIGNSDETAKLPAMVIYYGYECLGQIEGYFTDEEKNVLFEKINEIVHNKVN